MAALRDHHLVSAATPVAYDRGDVRGPRFYRPKASRSPAEPTLAREQSYTAWSYAPQPQREAAGRVEAGLPRRASSASSSSSEDERAGVRQAGAAPRPAADGRRGRRAERVSADLPAGAPRRRRGADPVRGDRGDRGLVPQRTRRSRTTSTRTSTAAGMQPLVWFVSMGRRATAVLRRGDGADDPVARYPWRVAAGFTSRGKYSAKKKDVDGDRPRRAHVGRGLFSGYGWLPFDPTPARGTSAAPTPPPRPRSTSRRRASRGGQAARVYGLRRQAAERARPRKRTARSAASSRTSRARAGEA